MFNAAIFPMSFCTSFLVDGSTIEIIVFVFSGLAQIRLEHFMGWTGPIKSSVISGQKKPAHDRPTGQVGPNFLGWAQAGPGYGHVIRAFYIVK
jgi:hypothetical protein